MWPSKRGPVFKNTEQAANYFFDHLLSNVPILADGKSYRKPMNSVKARQELFKAGIALGFSVDQGAAAAALKGGTDGDIARLATAYRLGLKKLSATLKDKDKIQRLMVRALHVVVQQGYLRTFDFSPDRPVGLQSGGGGSPEERETYKKKRGASFWDEWSSSGFSEGIEKLKTLLLQETSLVRGKKGSAVSVGLPTMTSLLGVRTISKSKFNSIFLMLEFGTGSLAKPVRPYSGAKSTFFKASPSITPYLFDRKALKPGTFFTNPLAAALQQKTLKKGGKMKSTDFNFPIQRYQIGVEKGKKRKKRKRSKWRIRFESHTSAQGGREFSGSHRIFELRKQAVLTAEFRSLTTTAYRHVLKAIEDEIIAEVPGFPRLLTSSVLLRQIKTSGTLGVFSF